MQLSAITNNYVGIVIGGWKRSIRRKSL